MQSFFWVIPALVLAVAVFYSVVAVAIRDEETERTLFDPVFPVSFRGLVRGLVNFRVANPPATVHGALRRLREQQGRDIAEPGLDSDVSIAGADHAVTAVSRSAPQLRRDDAPAAREDAGPAPETRCSAR
ncbi:hypothetical protein Tfu_0453 [Thermobifida fusca YX]|jgi:hypothetical protein|uniref:Uncharacterized protein n=2 Tax=Thermobifida fusca TaxID=2021 RepID=A0A9P2TBW6_THEFU|nr:MULTISPECIES: hypothetical protein [Thermobifida]AAZ54491.1 hypothetical protein Tfu_0453 [Thermobifida fusca YX]EOR72461.1 hypothetical protein TM51_02609 [Thermobifida fusca TM51]MBO2529647.1 permease [Thermobifida sp.]MDD6791203.1 permease [Thermobifida fusca]PPS92267.1 permease [Thermobifida fusca]